jgi:hypothetical protein
MKQNVKWLTMLAIMLIVFICLPSLVQAQFPDCPDPTVACPIDGGLSFLIAAGVVYGVKKVRDGRKQKQAGENI